MKKKNKNNLLEKVIDFVKYHNGFTIGLVLVFVFSGVIFASEDVRQAIIGEEIITETGIDNAQLLAADLENFDLEMQIINISEDKENYYVVYRYKTLGIKDSVWQPFIEEKHLTISKQSIEGRDLGLYLIEELGEVADYELSYLKEVQIVEKEKGVSKLTATVDYTGLIGLVLDVKEKILPGYVPVIPEPEPEICDGIDNDLDTEIDENLAVYSGSNVGQCQYAITDCVNGSMVQTQTEIGPIDEVCNDSIDNNCNGQIDENCCRPTTEICNNLDDDCDGLVDEDFGQISCGVGVCYSTINACAAGVIQNCVPGAPATELCDDNIDNDCDGKIDSDDEDCQAVSPPAPACDSEHLDLCTTQELCEGVSLYWYNDACNIEPAVEPEPEPVCSAGHLDLCNTQELCEGASLYWYNETCNLEPETPACQPTEEVCDGLDNDCDDQVDEDCDCGITPCDANLNLLGECKNTCLEGSCQNCTPTCTCAEGFFDCDSDLTNGCEVQGECPAPETPPLE